MKTEQVAGIDPGILRWARETAGFSVADVALRLKKPERLIADWESGVAAPTYIQLEKLAYEVYKRPLAVFFLPEPPDEKRPGLEFRTLPDSELNSLLADTRFHIRKAHAYQVAITELYEGKNPSERRIWTQVRLSVSRSFQEQAAEIRNVLNVGIEDQSSWGNDEEALRNWRRLVEESGIFVFKDAFKQKDISGFCLHDDGFPVIYLNNSTTKTRQIFSLLHEVAHLLFGQNGLSKFDADYIYGLSSSQQRIEVMCNSLAAEILIPAHDFAEQVKSLPLQGDELPDAVYARLARRYGVSREAVLRRFLDSGRVSQRFYETKAKKWNKQKKEKGGKGDWYASKGAYLSDKFLKDVYKKHYRNQLTVEQASDLLGIKAKNFGGMEKLVLSRGVA